MSVKIYYKGMELIIDSLEEAADLLHEISRHEARMEVEARRAYWRDAQALSRQRRREAQAEIVVDI